MDSHEYRTPANEANIRWRAAGAGGPSGICAGVFMGMAAMIHSAFAGNGFWMPLKLIGATFLGGSSLSGPSGIIVLGMTIHLVVSGILGAFFGALMGAASRSIGICLLAGEVYGIAAWGIATYFVLPVVNPTMSGAIAEMPGWWFAMHLIYGSTLALTPVFMSGVEPRHRKLQTTDVRMAH
jgi:hypothetical protein